MPTVGDVLALIHDAAWRARPAQLAVSEWRHNPTTARAWEVFMRARHGGAFVRSADPTPEPPEQSRWSVRLAYDGPDRYREESAGPQEGVRYLVRDGERWLTWDADWGLVTSESEPEGGPPASSFGFLLDPVELIAVFRLEPPTETTTAGRPALAVQAAPRRGDLGSAVFRVGPGADVVELVFDAETGALLRSEATLAGEPFHRLEVTEIAYGPLADETFALEPPPDHEGTAGKWARPVTLPLHELAATAPFTVLVPARLPDGWRVGTASFLEGRERPRIDATAFVDYVSPEGAYSIGIRERATPDADSGPDVVDSGATVAPRFTVTLVRRGTWIELSGSERQLLLDFASALEPAPTAPPDLAG